MVTLFNVLLEINNINQLILINKLFSIYQIYIQILKYYKFLRFTLVKYYRLMYYICNYNIILHL